MLDRSHTGDNRVRQALTAICVRRDRLAARPCLGHRGGDLVDGELGDERQIVLRDEAAGHCKLDPVRTPSQQFAHGACIASTPSTTIGGRPG